MAHECLEERGLTDKRPIIADRDFFTGSRVPVRRFRRLGVAGIGEGGARGISSGTNSECLFRARRAKLPMCAKPGTPSKTTTAI
jgi:hypothetical protein